MIVVWGNAGDSPVDRVLAALRARGADVLHLDEAALASLRHDVTIAVGAVDGWLALGRRRIDLGDVRGLYLRPGASRGRPTQRASATLFAVAATAPIVVLNRPGAGRSNASKPYQLGLIAAAGLDVPPTLVTSDPAAARAFLREHGRLVYKSISGVRSIVATLGPEDDARLDEVAASPVQFQAHVAGLDLRVHVVGERCFACAIHSDAADYRYAGATTGVAAQLVPHELPAPLAARLVALARRLGLGFAGIDLRLTPDGRWVCFEVNPSPGFSWYEEATGHPIAAAVAEHLLAGRP